MQRRGIAVVTKNPKLKVRKVYRFWCWHLAVLSACFSASQVVWLVGQPSNPLWEWKKNWRPRMLVIVAVRWMNTRKIHLVYLHPCRVFSPDKERFYADAGEFLVAIKYQGRTRYLQLSAQLVGHDEDFMGKVETDVPAKKWLVNIFHATGLSAVSTLRGVRLFGWRRSSKLTRSLVRQQSCV